jgi:hypothetical protein
MKDNLFKRIWNKNFVKATDKLDKFADDIGGLQGHFSWKKFNKNNQMIGESGIHNDITNLSKSTVIRLLAQGMPKYRTTIIDPTKYKISRMRFGNASYKDNNNYNLGGVKNEDMEFVKKLYYYDSTENVYRPNENNGIGKDNANNFKSAGGKISNVFLSDVNSIIKKEFYTSEAYRDNSLLVDNYSYPSDKFGSLSVGNVSIPIDKTSIYFSYLNTYSNEAKLYPPAHNSLKITLRFFNLGNNTNYTQVFAPSDIDKKIYNRSLTGNIFTSNIPNNDTNYITNNQVTLTYDNNLQLWKIMFTLKDNYLTQNFTNNTAKVLGRITIEYNIGQYNIINSIIPRNGINAGSSVNRFSSEDYYNMVSSVYDSSPTDFIDDYSVIFSSIMNVDQGNGQAGNSLPVIYTEAYLFNELDDLFSSITYPLFPIGVDNEYNSSNITDLNASRAFIKTSNDAYLFQWTIKALI